MSFEYPFHDRHGFPLPRASTDTDARVEVSPGLNTLSVPPRVHDALGSAVGVYQFPVVFAGYRSRTAAGVAFRVHKRELCGTTSMVVDGGEALVDCAHRLRGHDRALTDLQVEFGTVTRAGLHAFLSWLAEDETYVDWYANNYVDNDSSVDEAAVRDAIATLGRGPGHGGSLATLAADFRDLLDRHGLGVFETAIDIALDPPLATDDICLSPVDARGVTGLENDPPNAPRILATRDLEDRARHVLDSIADMEPIAGTERALSDFRTEVRRAIDDPEDSGLVPATAVDSWATQPAVSALPLLAEPHRARPADRSAQGHQSHVGYPTGQAWLFTQAYEDGGFGAVLYQRRGGDPNWLVNPYVASDALHDGDSYAAIWERAFVTDRLTARLLDRGGTPDSDERLACPLCALSSGSCSDDGCAFRDIIAAVQDRAVAIVDALESTQP
ncbi:hypothetical protein [Haloarchaeobius sp. DYHT-AS-18]|uniref:hypothetical protein n=1 Tax=Haloarchaeobius sp. DYHT-AS-18 TaxID=3446117 RepID=UPI003EBC1635